MEPTTLYVLGGLALIGLLAVWRSGRRAGRTAHKGVREVTRMTGNALRTLVTATVIVGAQYGAIWIDNPTITAIALIVPALLAGAAVARLLAVTEIVATTRGGHR
ncbi:hypothetical protein [Amycolatopsis sp. YIM 10]|uniref:hypothetical protein n=1 Tax=Amycolatopsis sp. YIM 10 TaxID=2653857 RepID=UPI00128FFBB5|nr:hypothetical protein [Amycolatopsis sp. YIM 10]QFU85724.1 hypothetical protein YIM_02495 [Amycolatopsis sp. YIM 10]